MGHKKVSKEVFEDIIKGISEGKTLRSLFSELSVHPMDLATYLSEVPDAQEKYDKARVINTETLAEDVISIADTEIDPARARNMIEARKWYASKLHPSKYGERIDINITKTVDIGSALIEARSRAITQNVETLEITRSNPDDSPGLEPALIEAGHQNDTDDDIFS